MSAFVIGTETMNRVVQMIVGCPEWNGPRFNKFAGIDTQADGAADKIGRKLYAMNIDAVQQRYPDTIEHPESMPGPCDMGPVIEYQYNNPSVSIVEGFKAMECLTYQCSEGDVPDSVLYKELERASHKVASEIVRATPAYERAGWDD